jgi:mRNA-degrading endonuclease HigB of HigAB toxin-antitoxin module
MHFKSILEKSSKIDKTSDDVMLLLIHLVKESQKPKEPEDTKSYFNFKFFKIRKTSVVIAVMGVLLFTLTVFSMKQQNDYTALTNEYYRQAIELRELRTEIDSLKVVKLTTKKRK